MKALVYHGPGQKAWEEVPDPAGRPHRRIVRMDTTTICGTDLHILKGDVPAVTDGRILGHEGVGTIAEVGAAVTKLAVGDRVIISCITSCGTVLVLPPAAVRRTAWTPRATSGIGWIFGHLIDGTQAEYVRVPFAEGSLHKLPAGSADDAALMLSDILPTGFEIGVRNGRVKPGDVVAVVGAGPVGPRRDDDRRPLWRVPDHRDRPRRQPARPGRELRRHRRGESARDTWKEEVLAHDRRAGGRRGDRGGRHPGDVRHVHRTRPPGRHRGQRRRTRYDRSSCKLQDLWIKDIAITTGLVSATTTPMLLKLVEQHKLPAEKFATHQLLARPDAGGLRHVRSRRRNQGAQGRHQPLIAPHRRSHIEGASPDLRFEWFSIVQRLAATPAAKINIPAVISSWPA